LAVTTRGTGIAPIVAADKKGYKTHKNTQGTGSDIQLTNTSEHGDKKYP